MGKIREQAKAITSGVLAGLGSLATALADQQVTQLEWVLVASAAIAAYGAVYGVGQPASLPKLPVVQVMDLAAERLSIDQAVTVAQRVGEREDRERAR